MAFDFNFETFVRDLQEIGFYDYFLPFILIFAITFALLENSGILGQNKKNINIIISMAVGLILIVQQPVVEIINTFLQKSSLIIVVILIALLVIFLIGGSGKLKAGGVGFGIVILIIILSLIWALSPNIGIEFPFWLELSDRTKNLILMLLIFLIVPLLIAGGRRQPGEGIATKLFQGLGDLIEGGGRKP